MKEYLSEIKNPSLFERTERPSELTMPIIEEYMSSLEDQRLSFINAIIDKSVRAIKAYIAELRETRLEIQKTGFVNNVNSADLVGGAMCEGEIGEMCSIFLHLNIVYRYICKSIDKTVAFLNIALGEETYNVIESDSKDEKTGVEPQKASPESDWLTVDGVCKRFGLPKNNIKDRKWRESNKFPTYQNGACTSVHFNKKDVEKWLQEHKC